MYLRLIFREAEGVVVCIDVGERDAWAIKAALESAMDESEKSGVLSVRTVADYLPPVKEVKPLDADDDGTA
jgi:hypothetical protein